MVGFSMDKFFLSLPEVKKNIQHTDKRKSKLRLDFGEFQLQHILKEET